MAANIDSKVVAGDILPRVYISNISLREAGKTKYTRKTKARRNLRNKNRSGHTLEASISLVIKDVIQKDQISTWMFNSNFTRFVNIKIIQSRDERLTKQLEKGNFSALGEERFENSFERKTLPVQKSSSKKTKGKSIEFDLKDYSSTLISGERAYNIPFETRFVSPDLTPEHLSYFAFTYLDMSALSKHYSMAFLKTMMKGALVRGTVTGEKVIVGSDINTTSYMFYEERTGKIWSGPKHKNRRQWYTGRKGSRSPRRLIMKEVINMKINDYRQINNMKRENIFIKTALRQFQKLQEKQLNGDQPPPTVHDSYISRGILSPKPNGQLNLLFHVDIEKLVKTQSAFGSLLDDMQNERAKKKIYLLSKIKSLKLLRKRVKNSLSSNRVGSPVKSNLFDESTEVISTIVYSADNRNGSLQKKINSTGGIREINTMAFSQGVRTFTATDKSMAQVTDGHYQYGVSIEVEDGIVKFLNTQLRRLNNIRIKMESYYNDAANPKYLNKNGSFKPTLARKYRRMARRRRTIVPWIKAIAVYVDVLTSLTTPNTPPQKFSRKLYSMINAQSGTSEGIGGFVQMIDQLIIIVESTLGNKKSPRKSSQNSSKSGNRSSGYKASVMTIDRYFRDLHDSNIPKNVGMNFLGKKGRQSVGVKSILVKDFFKRIGEENSIYWKNSDLGQVGDVLSADSATPSATNPQLYNLAHNEMAFLSPAEINGGSYTINRLGEGTDVWDADKYNAMASNLTAVQSGVYKNVTKLGDPASPANKKKTRDSKKNNLRGSVHSNSISNVLAQLGVTVLDTVEEKTLRTMEESEITELSVSYVFGTDDQATQVTSEEADTDDEVITKRKLRRINKEYAENIKALGNLFVNVVSANGTIDKTRRSMQNPTTQNGTSTRISDYNLTAVGNMVDTVTNTEGGTTVSEIPNQIRSLMFSNTDSTNTNFLNAPVDMLQNPETAQMMRNNFDTLAKVELFMGFAKDTEGNNIIDKPVYVPMASHYIDQATSGVILCRIRNYENKALNIGQNSGLNLQIYDNCFLMSTSQLNLLVNKKVQLSSRVVSISKAALATTSAIGESVAIGQAEEAARLAASLAEQVAAQELQDLTDEATARYDAAAASFAGGGKESMFTFFFNWLRVNTTLEESEIYAFLAIVDLDDRNTMITWLLSNTPMSYPEVTEFLDLLATLLYEEVIIEDLETIDEAEVFGEDLTADQREFLIDWLHDRGDMTYDQVEILLYKITNYNISNRETVTSTIKAWTNISSADVDSAMNIVYGQLVPPITPAEQAMIDAANAQADAIAAAATAGATATAAAAQTQADAIASAATAGATATAAAAQTQADAMAAAAQAQADAMAAAATTNLIATAAAAQTQADAIASAATAGATATAAAAQTQADAMAAAAQAQADAIAAGLSSQEATNAANLAQAQHMAQAQTDAIAAAAQIQADAMANIVSELSAAEESPPQEEAQASITVEEPPPVAQAQAATAAIAAAPTSSPPQSHNTGAGNGTSNQQQEAEETTNMFIMTTQNIDYSTYTDPTEEEEEIEDDTWADPQKNTAPGSYNTQGLGGQNMNLALDQLGSF